MFCVKMWLMPGPEGLMLIVGPLDTGPVSHNLMWINLHALRFPLIFTCVATFSVPSYYTSLELELLLGQLAGDLV